MIATRPADPPDPTPADGALHSTDTAATTVASNAMRLALLACAGIVGLIGWVMVWVLSYRLTHGNEFAYQFLVNYSGLWELLRDQLHPLANSLYPGLEQPGELGPIVPDMAINAFVVACVVLGVGYLAAITLLDLGISSVRGALAVIVIFELIYQLILVALPGLFTTDIFSYVMYGQISSLYNLNPYLYPPNYFPANELVDGSKWIHPIWHDQPAVYGPLWTNLGWLIAQATEQLSLMEQTLAYKLLMNVVQLINLALVWWLLGRLMAERKRERLAAFTVFAWNPLMLFDTAGNAHNDALMVTLLLLGVVPLVWRPRIANIHWAHGVFAIAMSVLIKYTTGLVGLFYLVPWLRLLRTWPARIAWIGGTGLVIFVVTAVLFVPWWDGMRSLQPILTAANGKSWQYSNSMPDVIAMQIDNRLLNPPRIDVPDFELFYQDLYATPTAADTRNNMKLITRALFGLYLIWECVLLWRRTAAEEDVVVPILQTATRVLTVLILLVLTWVLEWYWMWPLALASLLGWRSMLTKVVVGYTLTSLPVFYVHHFWSSHMPSWGVLAYALPPLAVPIIGWIFSRVRGRRPHLEIASVLTPPVADVSAVQSGR